MFQFLGRWFGRAFTWTNSSGTEDVLNEILERIKTDGLEIADGALAEKRAGFATPRSFLLTCGTMNIHTYRDLGLGTADEPVYRYDFSCHLEKPLTFNLYRRDKDLWQKNWDGEKVADLRLLPEARVLANEILEHIDRALDMVNNQPSSPA